MSLSDQTRSLMRSGAEWRQQTQGTTADGDLVTGRYDPDSAAEKTVPLYYTPVRTQEQLDAAGFHNLHDTIVRILKDELPIAQLGKRIRFDAPAGLLTVQISEFGNSDLNPEWVLGCKNL